MPEGIRRKLKGAVAAAVFVAGGVNIGDYFIAKERLSAGYSIQQIEEKFDYGKLFSGGDPLGAVFSIVGKPGRDLAYRWNK